MGRRRVQPRWADGGAAEVHVGRRRVQPRWADGVRLRWADGGATEVGRWGCD